MQINESYASSLEDTLSKIKMSRKKVISFDNVGRIVKGTVYAKYFDHMLVKIIAEKVGDEWEEIVNNTEQCFYIVCSSHMDVYIYHWIQDED